MIEGQEHIIYHKLRTKHPLVSNYHSQVPKFDPDKSLYQLDGWGNYWDVVRIVRVVTGTEEDTRAILRVQQATPRVKLGDAVQNI